MKDESGTSTRRGAVTQLLQAWNDGDDAARDQLMKLVAGELHEIAARHFRRESADHTLQPTALINELYLQLLDKRSVSFRNRAHFFGTVSEMMRRILVNHYRKNAAGRRGAGVKPFALDESFDVVIELNEDLEALDDALHRLAKLHPRQAKGVELYYFGGFSNEEVAETLGISVTQVKRDFAAARLWLKKALQPEDPG